MAIVQETTIQAYQLNKGGTPARMAILRMIAADSAKNANPHTRLAGAHEGEGFARSVVWYSHTGPNFRDEMYCDEVPGMSRTIKHTGWFTDTFEDSKARGIVARLTHGRFIAGYEWDSNGERVYFDAVHDNERDAALMADEHARVFAESAREHSEKFEVAREIEDENEERFARLRECIALRNNPCFKHLREEASELIEAIKDARETLRTDYAGVL